MNPTKTHPFNLTASDLVAFVNTMTGGEYALYAERGGLTSLNFDADEVKALIEPLFSVVTVDEAAKRLADRITKAQIAFPFETFDSARFDVIIAKLLDSGKNPDIYATGFPRNAVEVIGSCQEDEGRSHFIVAGERWGANHNYGTLWRPFVYFAEKIATIDNPSGQDAPGRFIDGCTFERLQSSVVTTGYVSPLQAWNTSLAKVCRKVICDLHFEYTPYHDDEVPIPYKKIGEANFRRACIAEFPCSFHFPPTSLHATLSFLRTRSPDLFKDGCRMLDPSAGHGHRLAGALSCPSITFMQATDPNKAMMQGYTNIFQEVQKRFADMDAELDIVADASIRVGEGRRKFCIVQGQAEDPNNPIYRVDKAYNLVFSSPPFFDTEHYSDPQGQSTTTFGTFQHWRDGFLEPMLKNCWRVLTPGGYMALNLTDTQSHKVVEALVHIVTETLQGQYLGVIPSRKGVGASRWTNREEKEVKMTHGADPIWVFQK